eukprot:CAMPEP_0117750504 /NCGR_PEP_ID=MMETSP0947-20121206/10415_1 /TAXON_ID=44440 /ORGANISM="Chattonella subsalsa, Strain CCMP2191" /LENGTH=601 /DNA_ID=CAMNT_0005568699 /DNA_START=89 /DNA_END=1894 /DNA_ORIENTATION=-
MMMTQSSGGAVLPQNPTMPTCSMYLQTGDCNFGQSCRFHHPVQDSTRQATGSTGTGYSSMMSGGMQGQGMQRQVMQGYGAGTGQQSGISGYQKAMGSSAGMGGYSMNATSKTLGASASQAKKKCKMYEKTGKCPFGASCKFEHESEESVGSPTPGSSVYARRTAMVGTGGMMGASGSMSSMGTTGMSGMGTTGISGMGTTGISGMATTGMSGMGTAGMSGMGTTGMNGMGGTGMSGMGSTGVSGVGSSMMGGMNALQQQAQLNMASMQGNMMNPQVQAQMNMAALQQQQQQQQQQQIGFSGLGTIGEAGMMGGSNRTVSAGGGSSWLADGQQSGGMGGMSGMDQMMGQREQLLRGQGDMQGQMGTRAQLPQKDEVCVMWVQLAQCKYGDKCSFKHPPIDVANQKLYTYNSNPGKGICRYYERQGCCKFLERCNMDHPQPRRPICYAFMTMFSCPRGVKCKFRHLSADQAEEDLKQWEQERKRICAETLKKKDEPKKPAKAQPTLPKTRSAEAAGLKSGLSSTSEPAPKKVTTGSASKSAVSKETASTGRKVSVTGTGSKVSVSATSRPRICFAFKNSGFCQYEDTCRFKHLTKAQAEAQGL